MSTEPAQWRPDGCLCKLIELPLMREMNRSLVSAEAFWAFPANSLANFSKHSCSKCFLYWVIKSASEMTGTSTAMCYDRCFAWSAFALWVAIEPCLQGHTVQATLIPFLNSWKNCFRILILLAETFHCKLSSCLQLIWAVLVLINKKVCCTLISQSSVGRTSEDICVVVCPLCC